MSLGALYVGLAEALDGDLKIERAAREVLLNSEAPNPQFNATSLPFDVTEILQAPDALPVCAVIADTPLPWSPPETSSDPAYIAHSNKKLHVELIGPDGFSPSDTFRIGLYGFSPHIAYGIRTHAAEEVFVMLAGCGYWKSGDRPYKTLGPGARAHHPSMMPHGTRSEDQAFMSIYVWRGDVSTASYTYTGRINT